MLQGNISGPTGKCGGIQDDQPVVFIVEEIDHPVVVVDRGCDRLNITVIDIGILVERQRLAIPSATPLIRIIVIVGKRLVIFCTQAVDSRAHLAGVCSRNSVA
jgi:hypothetical protein